MSVSEDRSVNLVDGGLFKPLVVLSTPIVLTMLLQVGYNLADTFWVGQLGGEALAALSFSWAIVFLMVSIGGGLTTAGTVLISQNKGANRLERAHHVAGQTIAFVTLVSLVFSVLGYLLTPTLLELIGAEPGSVAFGYAVDYTRVVFIGLQMMFWFFIFNALSRGWGDTRTPLYLMAVSVAINVVIDPVFVLGFQDNVAFHFLGAVPGIDGAALQSSLYAATGFSGWGVRGAAIATVLSRGTAAVAGLYLLFGGHVGLTPSLGDLRLRLATVRKIIDIGVPTAAEQGSRSLGIAVLTAIVAIAGTDAVAAYGIVSRLASLVFLPALGLARGTETVVGQNIGANQATRAKRAVFMAWGLIAAALLAVGAVAVSAPELITGVFITGEGSEAVVDLSAAYLTICGPIFAFLGVFQVTLGGFRGSGSTRTAMVFSIQELWLYRIPLSYILLSVVGMGVVGVWYAMAASYVLSAVTTAGWFLRGTWTDNELDDGEPDAIVPAD